jgi:signal transduction histidine kinase
LDTKWRSRSPLFVLALLFTLGLNGVLSGLSAGSSYVGRSYYETNEVQHQIMRLVQHLYLFELGAVGEAEARQQITVSQHEIEEHRYRYGDLDSQLEDIRNQYEYKILEAVTAGKAELAEDLRAERDAKLEDIRENFSSDEHIAEKIRKEKEAKLAEYFRELDQFRGDYYEYRNKFAYYLQDIETEQVYTNTTLAADRSNEAKLLGGMLYVKRYPDKHSDTLTVGTVESMPGYMLPHNEEVERAAAARPAKHFTGWIAVPKSAAFLAGQKEFDQRRLTVIVALIAGSAMLVASFLIGRRSIGSIRYSMDQLRPAYTRIPIDLRAALFLISGFITLHMLQDPVHLYYEQIRDFPFSFVSDLAFRFLILTCLLVVSVVQLYIWFRTLEGWELLGHELLHRSLLSRMLRAVGDAYRNTRVGWQVTVYTAVAFGLGLGAVIVAIEPEAIVLYFPAFILVALPLGIYAIRQMGYLNRILEAARDYEAGLPTADLPVRGRSVLSGLANHLNGLKRGVVVSQAKEAKSERLKTELITNVSHDLRTPLTAVISYVELLKKPDLTEEERSSYIGIIDQKSQRLKVLIDDLFEATKMASGSVELLRSRVDLVQLMKQAIAESEASMEQSGLQFRIKLPDEPVHAMVDGQKIWRVFDNLISNILRYSLEHTRVYMTLNRAGGRAEIVFKNIAKFELGDNVDELFERFKRGDGSRHTEGSGLGLAIAKSIVDLHGGTLELEVDGDLFKVTVLLPLE